jgi:membrane dipeptidase
MNSAVELLHDSLVWDNHACMPLRPEDDSFLPQLERARRSGFSVVSVNVGFGESTIEQHILMLAQMRAWLGARQEQYLLVRSPADIELAQRSGRLGICFDLDGASAIAGQLGLVQLYYDLGVRWALLAYNRNNVHGGGCHDDDAGLTEQGRAMLAAMAQAGMVACASHAGPRTAREVIDTSPNPVIFSHSNPRALFDHPRNVPDELLRACAARGGVVCINGISLFLGVQQDLAAAVVRHIDYVVQLVGPGHVGLGLDYIYDQQELVDFLEKMAHTFPADSGYHSGLTMLAPEEIVQVVEGLMGLGYKEADLRAILGGNLLRIARGVWK